MNHILNRKNTPLANYLVLLFALASLSMQSQHRLDSLKNLLVNHKKDTTYVKILVNLCNECNDNNKLKEGCSYAFEAFHLAEKLQYKKGMGDALGNMGVSYYYKGDYDSAAYYQERSVKYRSEANDKRGLATAYSNLGLLAMSTGKLAKALDYHEKSLKLNEEIKSKTGISRDLFSLGTVYYYQGNFVKTLDYFLKALKLNEEVNNIAGISTNINGIAVIYAEQKDYKKAMEYFQKAYSLSHQLNNIKEELNSLNNIAGVYLQEKQFEKALETNKEILVLSKEAGDLTAMSTSLNNIAGICELKGDHKEALRYANEGLAIAEKTRNNISLASCLTTLADLHYKNKEYAQALSYAQRGLELSGKSGSLGAIKDLRNALSQIYEAMGRHDLALQHYKGYISARDSLINDEKSKELTQKQMSFEFEKQMAEQKAEQEKQQLQSEARQKSQNIIIISVVAGFLLLAVFSFFLYKRFRLTNAQKLIIEDQKKMVEVKSAQLEEVNKEVIDSINYARRLQEAILPPQKMISRVFSQHFILYKPKAIVAGDFFWMEKVKDLAFLAAADCTGHGVPGAMVSLVCSNALTRAVKEFDLTEPGAILSKVRDLVIETFEKSESEVKDGMDISLISYNTGQTGSTVAINWAGANNALYYSHNGVLGIITPDKQPIGKSDISAPFTTHTITFQKEDCLYLVTDGYADQFGGTHGKKLKQKQLKELIQENLHRNMPEQKEILDKAFEDWKSGLQQVDDVTIIGVKF